MDSAKNNVCSLKKMIPCLQEEGFTIFGHGTGYDNIKVVDEIFNTGLRASHTSVFYTTIGLDIKDFLTFQDKLDHWPHKDSENIILIKLPNRFFNIIGNSSDLYCERTAAFVNKIENLNGRVTFYLDPKFIVGAYNRKTKKITINPNFEAALTDESINEMLEKLKQAIIDVNEKNKRLSEILLPHINQTRQNFDDWTWEDDFSETPVKK